MFGYFRDGVNPRGAEYGATARAARAAEQDAENTGDMLELQMAPNDGVRQELATRIAARRDREQGRRAWWHRLDLIASAIFVAIVVGYMITPDTSAVRQGQPSSASMHAQHASAPVRPAQAPCANDPADHVTADDCNMQYLTDAEFDRVAASDRR